MSEYEAMIARMQEITHAMRRLSPAIYRLRFAMLDMTLEETPLEDRPARSWEVEREDFLRRLEGMAGLD